MTGYFKGLDNKSGHMIQHINNTKHTSASVPVPTLNEGRALLMIFAKVNPLLLGQA